MSVERQRRDKLAELLRHFAAGRITNDEWDEAARELSGCDDPVLLRVWGTMWCTYDDLHEHRLTGRHALPEGARKVVARMILFLHSDLPYEWPVRRPWRRGELLLSLLTLGFVNTNPAPPDPRKDPVSREFWPFFRAEDLTRAAGSRPRLLGGSAQKVAGSSG